ncbi:hypothetical protein LQ938_09350 [Microbacterium sp. cx-55]|uniref:hypothetical protein n=1 Tax=unclassified Microbacterium TaxID=2609290 RepID=UPI001CBDB02A|nr:MULTISPECIES: hypothetical protein [unclassified Microbacterium]MBZ4486033.1 hypothetical protein [Microbacterium sp. cx-55]MCC4907025.1 hypothetical protein [Microbacterium sp. cx-59]UGB34095.1 hypothetical protein LQ938_09350 [Microbacterium sp. cx-55]
MSPHSWFVEPDRASISADQVGAFFAKAIPAGRCEFWFERDDGLVLGFLTNTSRALVMLLADADDPGEHAVSPTASPAVSSGFRLQNGQEDSYPDADTLPIDSAIDAAEHVIRCGEWPTETVVLSDR